MIRYAVRIAVDRCLPEARLILESRKVRRHAAMEASGINIY